MSITLPIVYLTPGTPQTIPLPNPDQVAELKVSNKSQYDVQYSNYGTFGTDWIPSGTEYMLYGAIQNQGSINLLAFNSANISPATAGPVLLTEYQQGDPVPPGSWPVAIPAQVINNVMISTDSSGTPFPGTGGVATMYQPLQGTGFKVLVVTFSNYSAGASAQVLAVPSPFMGPMAILTAGVTPVCQLLSGASSLGNFSTLTALNIGGGTGTNQTNISQWQVSLAAGTPSVPFNNLQMNAGSTSGVAAIMLIAGV